MTDIVCYLVRGRYTDSDIDPFISIKVLFTPSPRLDFKGSRNIHFTQFKYSIPKFFFQNELRDTLSPMGIWKDLW